MALDGADARAVELAYNAAVTSILRNLVGVPSPSLHAGFFRSTLRDALGARGPFVVDPVAFKLAQKEGGRGGSRAVPATRDEFLRVARTASLPSFAVSALRAAGRARPDASLEALCAAFAGRVARDWHAALAEAVEVVAPPGWTDVRVDPQTLTTFRVEARDLAGETRSCVVVVDKAGEIPRAGADAGADVGEDGERRPPAPTAAAPPAAWAQLRARRPDWREGGGSRARFVLRNKVASASVAERLEAAHAAAPMQADDAEEPRESPAKKEPKALTVTALRKLGVTHDDDVALISGTVKRFVRALVRDSGEALTRPPKAVASGGGGDGAEVGGADAAPDALRVDAGGVLVVRRVDGGGGGGDAVGHAAFALAVLHEPRAPLTVRPHALVRRDEDDAERLTAELAAWEAEPARRSPAEAHRLAALMQDHAESARDYGAVRVEAFVIEDDDDEAEGGGEVSDPDAALLDALEGRATERVVALGDVALELHPDRPLCHAPSLRAEPRVATDTLLPEADAPRANPRALRVVRGRDVTAVSGTFHARRAGLLVVRVAPVGARPARLAHFDAYTAPGDVARLAEDDRTLSPERARLLGLAPIERPLALPAVLTCRGGWQGAELFAQRSFAHVHAHRPWKRPPPHAEALHHVRRAGKRARVARRTTGLVLERAPRSEVGRPTHARLAGGGAGAEARAVELLVQPPLTLERADGRFHGRSRALAARKVGVRGRELLVRRRRAGEAAQAAAPQAAAPQAPAPQCPGLQFV